MTKIDSTSSPTLSTTDPEIDPHIPVDANSQETATDLDARAEKSVVEDDIQRHEEDFFESLGRKTEALVEQAAQDLTQVIKAAPDALELVVETSAESNGELPFTDAVGAMLPTSDEISEDARKVATKLKTTQANEQIPRAALRDLCGLATQAYEKYAMRGEDPLEMIRNIPSAADRVVNNVNDAMKDVFGHEALEFTLEPGPDDIVYTLEQLTAPDSKLRTQARTGLTLAGFEVLRENAGIIEGAADSRTARSVSNYLEARLDTMAAVAAMGLGTLAGGVPGMVVGAFTAKQIMTDEIELPFFGADNLSELMNDIQSNPKEYRSLIGAAQGPFSGTLEALEEGESLSKWTSLKLKGGKGVVGSGQTKIKTSAQKLDRDTYKLDIETNIAGSLGIGARLQELGMDVSIAEDKGAKVSLIFKGPNASKSVSSIMRGDLNTTLLMSGLPTVDTFEVSRKQKLSATALKHLELAKSAKTSLGINTENVVASRELEGSLGVDFATSFLSLKGLTDDRGTTQAREIVSSFVGPPRGTGYELKGAVSVKGAVEVDHKTGAVELVVTLKAEASREALETRGTVDIRLTDLENLLKRNDLSAEELLEMATDDTDTFLKTIGAGDFGIQIESKAQVRDVQSAELDMVVGKFGGSRKGEWRDINFEGDNRFEDPRFGNLRV